MSFETKIESLVENINKRCVFCSRSNTRQTYPINSALSFAVTPIADSNNCKGMWKGNFSVKLKFDDLKLAENHAMFMKYNKQIVYIICNSTESAYDSSNVFFNKEYVEVFRVGDRFFGLRSDACHIIGSKAFFRDVENVLKRLYLTHDIVAHDNMFDDLFICKLLDHDFKITHCFDVANKKLLYNLIELKPYQLKQFFEEICEKTDSIKNNELYGEYKQYVINKFAKNAIHYDKYLSEDYYKLNSEEPEIDVYDFVTWKRKVYDVNQEEKRKSESVKTYIDMIEKEIKDIKPSAKKRD